MDHGRIVMQLAFNWDYNPINDGTHYLNCDVVLLGVLKENYL